MENLKFRVIVYNEDEACADFIFIDKLNIIQRLQLGCSKVKTAKNTYYIRTNNINDFMNCLRNTIPYQESENAGYEFYCAHTEPRRCRSCRITFDALLGLVVRDFDVRTFDDRNKFIVECKKIKQAQIEKTIKQGDDFVDKYERVVPIKHPSTGCFFSSYY